MHPPSENTSTTSFSPPSSSVSGKIGTAKQNCAPCTHFRLHHPSLLNAKDERLHKTQTEPHNNGILRHREHITFNYTATALFVFVLRPYTQQSTTAPAVFVYTPRLYTTTK
mmetsp:Transcript_31067/g.56913  ORF Transcript_31067/g.56913 Transcript_31067/m.56913 type:complete len:111 (+) Transcript_31067:143-475(+)